MAIYRLDLDKPAVLRLLGGTTLLGSLLFFSGTLVGYSASFQGAPGGGVGAGAAPPAQGSPQASAGAPGVGFASDAAERECPVQPDAATPAAFTAATMADAAAALGGDALPPRWSALDRLAEQADQVAREADAAVGYDRAAGGSTGGAVDEILAPRVGGDDPTRTAIGASGRYAVQVGAFSVRGHADALAARLRGRGYDPLIVTARSRSGQWLEYVHLSTHPAERAAQVVAGEFTRKEQLPALVVAVADDGGAPR